MGRVHGELTELEGCGPKTAERLQAAGYEDIAALAFAFPTRYRRSERIAVPAADLIGDDVTFVARCVSARSGWLRGGRNYAAARLEVEARPRAITVEARFFGQSYLAAQLGEGRAVEVAGVLEAGGSTDFVLKAPRIRFDAGADRAEGVVLDPIYARVEGVKPGLLRKLIERAVERVVGGLDEPRPAAFLAEHDLSAMPEAVATLHAGPLDTHAFERARRRIALAEAVELLSGVRQRREQRNEFEAPPIEVPAEVDGRIRERLPFRLSADQDRCVADITRDLARPRCMARLLQGDVGSGKTLVAVYACLAAAANGFKAVLLAPTELLAEQHASRLRAWLAESSLDVVCYTQSLPAAEKRAARAALRAPAPCLIVGTHALFSTALEIEKLGLLVVDEQHRFGVAQRGHLFQTGRKHRPHVLVMSATPIPRTLATALYADLDVSEIRAGPIAREPVVTELLPASQWPSVRDAIVAEVGRGGRVFVVCPRIDGDAASAVATFAELRDLCPAALAHGQLDPAERRAAEDAFRSGAAQCLVATTVIEVGVDVPEATLMVVRDADRLGLSSLHQLRGRVGRGVERARCILLGDPEVERLRVLTREADGFAIAEADLRERGAGEITGRLQHGHRAFRCLDPLVDFDILRLAVE